VTPIGRPPRGRAVVPGPGSASRTGDPDLDQLLAAADAHVESVVGNGPSGPSPMTADSPRRRELAAEDAGMARAAREFTAGEGRRHA